MNEETFKQSLDGLVSALRCAELELTAPTQLETDEQKKQFQFYYLGLQYAYNLFTGNIWESDKQQTDTQIVEEPNQTEQATSTVVESQYEQISETPIHTTSEESSYIQEEFEENPQSDLEIALDNAVESGELTEVNDYSQDIIFSEILGQYIITYHTPEFAWNLAAYLNDYAVKNENTNDKQEECNETA